MNWLNWVMKNMFRNGTRTLLTFGSVAASLFLLSMLSVAYRFLDNPDSSDATHLLLVVSPRASMAMQMPLWYQNRIAALPGVAAVSPFGYFPGRYGADDALIPALAFQPDRVFDFFNDWKLPDSEKKAFISEKSAMVAGRKLADKYGWKIGDRIHLTASLFSNLRLELVLRGIYTAPANEDAAAFHFDYLNEALGRSNKASQFWVRARSADDIPRLTRSIDDQFRNASVETRTGTLKQTMLNFLSLLGNVKLMLVIISAAVVFAVLLVVANTMAMSIRERTAEIATLRALGFRRLHILGLLAGESILITLAGAALGSLGAIWVSRLLSGLAIGGAMPANLGIRWPTLALVLTAAVSISVLSTMIPALRASRLNIARALRYVG